ncbi:MAG: methionyl-tRNA formyltransferase [Candidatus Limnocylindrales bacterium]
MTVGRPRTVFIGTGPFGLEALRALATSHHVELVGILTAPARPAGRDQRLVPGPIELAAREAGLGPILSPTRLQDPRAVAEVLDLDPALAVLADYGRIVPAALLGLPLRALNLHPSLLPRHRGAAPIPAAILEGDRETGVSILEMDEGIDHGPIVASERLSLTGHETAPELEADLGARAADLLVRTLPDWIAGRIEIPPAGRGSRDHDPAAPAGGWSTRPTPVGRDAGASGARHAALARDLLRDAARAADRPSRDRRPERDGGCVVTPPRPRWRAGPDHERWTPRAQGGPAGRSAADER